jgi:Putative auto-transporter adhesin, head GIN domain
MRSLIPLFAMAFAASAPALAAEVVPVPEFRSVQLRGGGEILLRPGPVQRVTLLEGSSQITRFRVRQDGKLQIDVCNGRCPRHYRLRIEIHSPRVPDAAISGGGSIRAAGGFARQSHLSAAVNGGGAIDLRAVDARDVSAAVNGGGKIEVRPRRSLSAAVNGGGAVRYWGNPQVHMAVHGGGTVQPGN